MGSSTWRFAPGVAVAVAVLLLGAIPLAHGSEVRSGSTAATGPCTGESFSPQYTGALSVVGGALPSGASVGAGIRLSFFEEVVVVDEPSGLVANTSCQAFNESLTTNTSGDFAFSEAPFATVCLPVPNGTVCTGYSGPRGPLAATLSSPVPAGYATSFRTTPFVGNLSLVWELASVTVDPGGPTLGVAPGAATSVVASGWEANGSATPLAAEYAWSLNGTGWAFEGPTSGARAVVESAPGAGAGTLSVRASATVNGTPLSPPEATVALDSVPTVITNAQLNRTDLDVGGSVNASVTATGAFGYTYRARITPGLGLAAVSAPCRTVGVGNVSVVATCTANLTYSGAGVAQPTATITNGFSTGDWSFPNVTVNPPAALWVDPLAPAGYVGTGVPIELIATNGSGTLPFRSACLDPGAGPDVCTTEPGPRWNFDPVYAAAGSYPATAWTIDAGGTNRSVAFSVTVAPALGLGALDLAAPNATADSNVTVNSTIAGGVLPGWFWWNSSLASSPLSAGPLNDDGPVSVQFTPASAGTVTISLTVVDALGTVVRGHLVVPVAAPPATRLAEVDPLPTGPVEVGAATAVAWVAYDRSDERVATFAAAAEIVLTGSGATVPTGWVNASGVGPLSGPGDGTFDVPASAWTNGTLAVSVDVRSTGTVSVNLTGDDLPSTVAPIRLDAVPDSAHLRLFGPIVARPGTRDNATYWSAADRFGNPVPGANVTVRFVWGNSTSYERVFAVVAPNGTTGVWINFTAPGAAGGTVTVFDGANATVLGPLIVPPLPAAPSPSTSYEWLVGVVGVGAVGAAAGTVVLRRARPRATVPADEAALQRLAEGRAAVVEIVRRAGSADLTEIEAAWRPAPAPADLADWLASLVADGTLGGTVGSDGRARFCLAPGPASPRVTLDPQAFDDALRRRDSAIGTDDPDL